MNRLDLSQRIALLTEWATDGVPIQFAQTGRPGAKWQDYAGSEPPDILSPRHVWRRKPATVNAWVWIPTDPQAARRYEDAGPARFAGDDAGQWVQLAGEMPG